MIVGLEYQFSYTNEAVSNPVTGKTVPVQNNSENDRFIFTYDASGALAAVTRAQSGSVEQITLPGPGVVAHITGLAVYDDTTGTLIKGSHPQLVAAGGLNLLTFCTALS